ncbi:MAG: tetratricopeptide repeat protein, partial [Burkholderiales bacterium]
YLKELVEHQRRDNFTSNKLDMASLLPLPNFAKYVNRSELEEELIDRLTNPDITLTVCKGLGGVGKSQLVKYIIHQKVIKEHFRNIYWFSSADNPTQLQDQVRLLTIDLGLVSREEIGKMSFEEIRGRLLRYLEKKQGPILLVFDNADDATSLEGYLPKGKTQIHRLITTREPDWSDTIKVGVLHPSESQALIEKLLLQVEPQANVLAEFLGHLPLGITHGCAYIRQEKLSINAFIKEIQKNASVLKRNPKLFGQDLPHSVASLWQATFKKLEEKYPTALRVLESLSFCDAEKIPTELLEGLFNKLELLASMEVRQALISYELLEERELKGYARTHKGFSMHRLLHQVLQSGCRDEFERGKEVNIAEQELLLPLLEVLHSSMPYIKSVPSNKWEQGRLYASNVAYFLTRARQGLTTSSLLASICARMQTYTAYVQNNYQESLEYAKESLEMRQTLCKGDHPDIADALSNLGLAYKYIGQHQNALRYFKEALKMIKDIYGDNYL